MAKVRVIARAVAQPGKATELRNILQQLLAPTRDEQGCEYYDLFESNIPDLFYFDELWTTQEDLDAHAASAHLKELIPMANKIMAAPIEVNLLTLID